jgi:hypothetical protein
VKRKTNGAPEVGEGRLEEVKKELILQFFQEFIPTFFSAAQFSCHRKDQKTPYS